MTTLKMQAITEMGSCVYASIKVSNDYTMNEVVIVVSHMGMYGYKDVVQVVRVSDGKELLPEGACRPCDNLDDAIDVAGEMLAEA